MGTAVLWSATARRGLHADCQTRTSIRSARTHESRLACLLGRLCRLLGGLDGLARLVLHPYGADDAVLEGVRSAGDGGSGACHGSIPVGVVERLVVLHKYCVCRTRWSDAVRLFESIYAGYHKKTLFDFKLYDGQSSLL